MVKCLKKLNIPCQYLTYICGVEKISDGWSYVLFGSYQSSLWVAFANVLELHG